MNKTTRITNADGTKYDVLYELVPAVPAIPESWKVISITPVPPPVVDTNGKITSFNAICGSVAMLIGGQTTKNLNRNATSASAWSITKTDDTTMRYEVRVGDVARAANGWADSPTSERSETELLPRYPAGVPINISYGFTLEPGLPNKSQWVIIGQMHFDLGSGSPPFAIALFGEKMCIICRGRDNAENRVWTDPNPIQRGKKYAIRIALKFNGDGYGTCNVWRDDVQIVKFVGPLGSGVPGDTHYFKMGVYRNQSQEALAASYSNLSVTTS